MYHRVQGAAGAALTNYKLAIKIIGGGIYIHLIILKIIIKLKERKSTILVIDAIRETDLGEGTYEPGGQKIMANYGSAKASGRNFSRKPLNNDESNNRQYGE